MPIKIKNIFNRDDKKVIIFLDKKKKWYLVYSKIDDLTQFKEPFDCDQIPLSRLNDIDEKWLVKKVVSAKNKLSFEFEKLK